MFIHHINMLADLNIIAKFAVDLHHLLILLLSNRSGLQENTVLMPCIQVISWRLQLDTKPLVDLHKGELLKDPLLLLLGNCLSLHSFSQLMTRHSI